MLRSFVAYNGKKLYFQAVSTTKDSAIESIHRKTCQQSLESGDFLWWGLIELQYDHKKDSFVTVIEECERRDEPKITELNVQAKKTSKKKKPIPEEAIQQILETLNGNDWGNT